MSYEVKQNAVLGSVNRIFHKECPWTLLQVSANTLYRTLLYAVLMSAALPISEEINTRDEIEANKDGLYYNKHEDYSSFDNVKYKIHIDHPYNLKFSYIIGFKFVDANFSPTNTITKDKVEHKGKNVVCFINPPIFVGKLSVVTNLSCAENMDSYCDVGIDDDIFGEPFCSKVDIIVGRFEGKIIIHCEKVSDWIEHAHMHEMN
ncbi:hypothetical protein Tco_1471324 [Tanacetum coccineum]|uniref:Uncharacterized protein n=1 Tax=Tanacetum coccineum TaxID=301880 RepID=A0ABQ5AQG4_9ASTR